MKASNLILRHQNAVNSAKRALFAYEEKSKSKLTALSKQADKKLERLHKIERVFKKGFDFVENCMYCMLGKIGHSIYKKRHTIHKETSKAEKFINYEMKKVEKYRNTLDTRFL